MRFKEYVRTRILPLINGVLGVASLKLVPASTPNRDFDGFVAHLGKLGHTFRTVIDVGVAHGTPGLYNSTKGAQLYLVEPVPACAPILAEYARTLGAKTFNVAAGAEDGVLRFNVHSDISGSSAFDQWEGARLDGETVEVPMRRLDSIIEQPIARPCLLKVDTQGAELMVLEGASGILDQIDVIIVECSFHQFRHGAPEFNEIVIRMNELGFACYETLEGHYRALDNALAQVDLVFVPFDSPLRRDKGYFSQQQIDSYLKAS
ncbi:MAG: FkbM family methyltransferase [Brevundimonas sp.]|nr:FkbM family methyltransferase [Brevundimonas sp.]